VLGGCLKAAEDLLGRWHTVTAVGTFVTTVDGSIDLAPEIVPLDRLLENRDPLAQIGPLLSETPDVIMESGVVLLQRDDVGAESHITGFAVLDPAEEHPGRPEVDTPPTPLAVRDEEVGDAHMPAPLDVQSAPAISSTARPHPSSSEDPSARHVDAEPAAGIHGVRIGEVLLFVFAEGVERASVAHEHVPGKLEEPPEPASKPAQSCHDVETC